MQLVSNPDLSRLASLVPEGIKAHMQQDEQVTDVKHTLNMLSTIHEAGMLLAYAVEVDDEYVGCLVAVLSPTIHSPEIEAQEHVFYLHPESRSLRNASALLKAYIYDCERLGIKRIHMANTGSDDDRIELLYKRFKFLPLGRYYLRED